MKKNWTLRVASLALTLTLISTCFVGGTLAKYTSNVTGNGLATVAAWKIKAGDTDGGTTFTRFTLEETANTAIAAGHIAPGAEGTLPVFVDITGTEVSTNVEYWVKVDNIAKLPTNFKMKLRNGSNVTFTANDTYVLLGSKSVNLVGKTAIDATDGKWDTAVLWDWAFETNGGAGDADDTADGIEAAGVNFTLKVVATQLA